MANGFRKLEGVPVYVKKVDKPFEDNRGTLLELFRNDEMFELPFANIKPEMGYISVTKPGMIRGPHEHYSQADVFVFIGPGNFVLHLWHKTPTKINYRTINVGESRPRMVVVPPGVVHGYKCISEYPGTVYNFPNKLYRGWGKLGMIDEIRHEENPSSPYRIL